MSVILHAQALTAGYHRTAVIQDAALQLSSGEILTLIGPNGAGKSTLLRSLIRQLPPMSGVIMLHGKALQTVSPNRLARQMAVVMTDRIRPELMTCGEVVRTGRYPYTGHLGILSCEDEAFVREAMELVEITPLRDTPFQSVSDGQRQRVMLARAICQQPEILVLDEPTSYLDIRHKLELCSVLRRIARKRGVAILMTLHELELALKCSDRIVCVRQGRIEKSGTPEEIIQDDYISRSFRLDRGSFDPVSGTLELEPPCGTPELFVIGGGGTAIPLYRTLQRREIPFYTGVLHENDIELPVARALAGEVFVTPAFEAISEESLQRASEAVQRCRRVICCVSAFGTMNEGNNRLLHLAQRQGSLTTLEELLRSKQQGGSSNAL